MEICPGCLINPATYDLHPCPYNQEINEDDNDCCECCEDCEQECAWDI